MQKRQSMFPKIEEFTSADFRSLAGVPIEKSVCLSIFVPINCGGQIPLTNCGAALNDLIRAATTSLEARGVKPDDVRKWLAPIE